MDEKICPYCREPIDSKDEVFVLSDRSIAVHSWCAEDAALEEVTDTYNEKGCIGLEELDAQQELNDALE